ncbi:MAG: hypothetical protein Q7R83_01445 [bacterium]|nr:hypothetical protein [bacterium]
MAKSTLPFAVFINALGRALDISCYFRNIVKESGIPMVAFEYLTKPEAKYVVDKLLYTIRTEWEHAELGRKLNEQRAVAKARSTQAPTHGFLTVPDVDAHGLLRALLVERRAEPILSMMAEWDFMRNRDGETVPGRGKRFEWWICERLPAGRTEHLEENRSGCHGHSAAFIQWLREFNGSGFFATFPTVDACPEDDGTPVVPFGALEDGRLIFLNLVDRDDLEAGVKFVGFRLVEDASE